MAGIIREAKEINRYLEKRKKEAMKGWQLAVDQGIEPGYTVEELLARDMDIAIERFKRECTLAVKLRDVAIEVGMIRSSTPTIGHSAKLVGRYCFISLRPAPGACFATFRYDVERFTRRGLFISGEYAFEQIGTSEDELGNGFHAHILAKVKDYVQFKEINRDAHADIRGEFTIQVGDDKYKFLRTERDLEYCQNYIRGDKHDDSKVAACLLNDTWRAMNNLERVYCFNNESSTVVVVETD